MIVFIEMSEKPRQEDRGIVHVYEDLTIASRLEFGSPATNSVRLKSGRCSSSPGPPTRTIGTNQFDQTKRLKGTPANWVHDDFLNPLGSVGIVSSNHGSLSVNTSLIS